MDHTETFVDQGVVVQQDLAQNPEFTKVPDSLERPSLAPNVRLVGEMQETGFQDRQWLIQSEERFIQVTELLYRVAEQIDGECTLEEIAAAVTESTDWIVNADQVRQLLFKLIPLGVIDIGGDSALSAYHSSNKRDSSPLRLNLQKRILSPHLVRPLTQVLQYLYLPVVLIPMLLVIAIAHGWLYFFGHGLANSIMEVLYTPGLLLVVLGIMILAGIFHELGHAAALQYGGGEIRGMGVGFYLVYPVFYTDTTDSYRLGRWARVRTDLGGFYFHLIFALCTIALYWISGQEFLLSIVLIINLDIIYQLLPFIRLDGYWALADLTGIPDFFSQMGPFLAGTLDRPGWKGSKLPKLKPWVKVVFTLYILLTLPVLALLSFLLVTRLPGLLAVTWDSFLIHVQLFYTVVRQREAVGALVVAAQMLLLALPVLGGGYILYNLGSKLFRAVQHWRSGSRVASRRYTA